MGMGGFPAERTQKCQAPIKLAQPFPAPEFAGGNFMDITLFLNWEGKHVMAYIGPPLACSITMAEATPRHPTALTLQEHIQTGWNTQTTRQSVVANANLSQPDFHTHKMCLVNLDAFNRRIAQRFLSQPQSITQKGVHARLLTTREVRTLVFAAFEPFSSHEFRASIARTPFCVTLWRSPNFNWSETAKCP